MVLRETNIKWIDIMMIINLNVMDVLLEIIIMIKVF